MRVPSYTKQFHKDVELAKKRGKKVDKLKEIMSLLIEGKKLPDKNRDHKLVGIFKNFRECHIEPDWLLMYKSEPTDIVFLRTGTHADLFD